MRRTGSTGGAPKAVYGAEVNDIECGMELTGGVDSSNLWGEVEVVVGGLVGPGGKIERPGGISPKNRLSSRVGSISVRGAIGLQCAWGKPVG